MQRLKSVKILLAIVFALILTYILYTIFSKDTSPKNEITQNLTKVQESPVNQIISGEITTSGYIPQGSTISVLARKIGNSDFQQIYSSRAVARVSFTFAQAEDGYPYEVKARLTTPTDTYDSDLVTVVAPAQNESIRILSKASSPDKATAQIQGKLSINGIIPQGAAVTLAQKSPSNKQFTNFGDNIQASSNLNWNWNSAKSGNTYEIIAYLVSNGQIIGTSNTVTTSAPATAVELALNSQNAQSTAQRASISGKFDINGIVPDNSFASIGIREVGQSTFELLGTNITAKDEVGWSWNSAESGKSYEIQGYITSNSIPIAQTEIVSVTAPAADQILTFNVDYSPGAPSGNSLTASCVQKNSKDKWQVKLTMNADSSLKDASQYHLQFGSIQSATEFIDSKITPQSKDGPESLTTDYILTQGTTYYAKYAYQKIGFSQFSPFSPPRVVTCQ